MISGNNSNNSNNPNDSDIKQGEVKVKDSTTRFLDRTREMIESLEKMLKEFPEFQNPSFFKRALFSSKVGRARNKFNAIKAIFAALLARGKELYGMLPKVDEDTENKIIHITKLSQDPKFVETVINYLAASATIGLILNDVLKIAASFDVSLQHTAVLSSNRSSKIVLMMDEIINENKPGQKDIAPELREKLLPKELRDTLEGLKMRLNAVANISDIVTSFTDYVLKPAVKSEKQLLSERMAEEENLAKEEEMRLAEEKKRKESGIWDELEDGFVILNDESKDPKVKALREFSKNFDMDLLYFLLDALRQWKRSEKNSTARLNEVICTLIKYSDNALLEKKHTVDAGLKYKECELENLALQIDKWMNDGIQDHKMQIYILKLKHDAVVRIKAAEELSSEDLKLLTTHLKGILGDEELQFADEVVANSNHDEDQGIVEEFRQEVGEEAVKKPFDDSTTQLLGILADLGMTNYHDEDSASISEEVKPVPVKVDVSKIRDTVKMYQMPYSAPTQDDNGQKPSKELK